MTRLQLEHIIRASGGVADDTHIVVVGSQSVLGSYPEAPGELLVSIEADVYPKHHPENSIVIDGAIGELSMFHLTYGYYAHGVGEETAVLPEGWKERVVAVRNENTNGYTGECLEVHDLTVSKLAAGREKDMDFMRGLLNHHMISTQTVAERIGLTQRGGEQAQETMRMRWRSVLSRRTLRR